MFFPGLILKQVYVFQTLKEMKTQKCCRKLELEPTTRPIWCQSLLISLLRDKLPQISLVPTLYWKTKLKRVRSTLISALDYIGWGLKSQKVANPGAGKGCSAIGSPCQPAGPEGQRGTDGGPRPKEAAQEPPGPGFSTRAPRTGPIRARRQASSPRSRPQRHHSEKRQRGTEASRGRDALRRGWNCLRDGGGARRPARKRRQGFSF